MWKCPVCDKENNAATVCPTCGYDQTCDYEQYPTAFAVTTAKPTRTLRRQWQEKQNPPVKGSDLRETAYVNSEEAAQGCQLRVTLSGGGTRQVTIPGGCTDGKRLRYTGLGHSGSNGGKNGDLLVTVRVQEPPEPDGLYDAPKDPPVKGGDLRATVYITPNQAAQGCQLRVTLSGGGTRQVTIPGGCTDGKRLRYTGLGQPGRNGGKNGDLLVTVRVQKPEAPKLEPARPPEKLTWQSELTPTLAAQGCTRSIPFKHNGKETSLTLFIPAGVVYGEKLHYPQVRADDGTLCDVTLSVVVQNDSFLGSLAFLAQVIATLPFIISLIVCIFTSFSISIFTDIFSISLVVMIPASIIRNISQSRNKKKYGPKTPEEKRRCETPREMPPQR